MASCKFKEHAEPKGAELVVGMTPAPRVYHCCLPKSLPRRFLPLSALALSYRMHGSSFARDSPLTSRCLSLYALWLCTLSLSPSLTLCLPQTLTLRVPPPLSFGVSLSLTLSLSTFSLSLTLSRDHLPALFGHSPSLQSGHRPYATAAHASRHAYHHQRGLYIYIAVIY